MSEPWVERYRPRTLADILGNPQAIADLRKWAEAWHTGKPQFRAVILSGAPGTGKTSAAHAVAQEFGWGLIELNASDARSAPAIQRVAGMGSVHETFSSTGEYQRSKEGQRKLIVLDEADNLYERPGESTDAAGTDLSDRGGKRAILDTIANTRQPIILIANDLYALTKGAGERLERNALKVPFKRLLSTSVRKRLAEIAAKEGVAVSDEVLQQIAAQAEGDLRSAINDLEAVASGRTRVDRALPAVGERNRSETAFDVMGAILKGTDAKAAIDAARNLDETPDFLLAWVDENVAHEYRDPHDLLRAMEHLSRADILLGRTLRRQHFGLWGYATELIAGGVSSAKRQRYGTPPRYQFPSWIRRMGQSKGARGARDRLAEQIAPRMHMSENKFLSQQLTELRALCSADEEFAIAFSVSFELEDEDIRFLLKDSTERARDAIIAQVEARKQEARPAPKAEAAPTPARETESESARPSRHRGTRLGDF